MTNKVDLRLRSWLYLAFVCCQLAIIVCFLGQCLTGCCLFALFLPNSDCGWCCFVDPRR